MSKCDISKCHASCCYNAPLPKKYIFALKNRIVNPVKEIMVLDNENMKNENMKNEIMCYPITDYDPEKNKCPFLTENCRCNIYDRRPPICRKFGNGTEPLLTCTYLVPEEQRESVLAGYKSAVNISSCIRNGKEIQIAMPKDYALRKLHSKEEKVIFCGCDAISGLLIHYLLDELFGRGEILHRYDLQLQQDWEWTIDEPDKDIIKEWFFKEPERIITTCWDYERTLKAVAQINNVRVL